MSIYADTNYIVASYLGTANGAQNAESDSALPVTWLGRLEVINAFQQAVLTGFGAAQMRVSAEFAAACQQQFREDLLTGYKLRHTPISNEQLAAQFEDLALRHTAKHGFRTYDILHVSAALALRCRSFWSFDKRASKLAKLEGLKVLR